MRKMKPSAIAAEPVADQPLRFNSLALAVAVALSAPIPLYAESLPTGLQTLSGSVTVTTPTATSMNLNQTSQNANMSAQTFSIGFGNRVDVLQPNTSSILMVNVVGNNPSSIFGTLTANGRFWLVNTAGVLFGPTASVNVGGLVASTMPISFSDAISGHYVFSNSGNSGSVVNQGSITALNGYVGLFAPQVVNEGVIVARMGTVALAAGNQVTLDMVGDGLIKVSVDQAALNAAVMNKGTIEADGGNVLLTARSANALLDTVINTDGVIRANSIGNRNGTIVLDGGNAGIVSVSGTLEARGAEAGSTGGTIKVLGQYVGVGLGNSTASIDASGDAGGGTVLIGGNFQGKGLEQNSFRTFVGQDATINADAVTSGNGGKVIVWADDVTRYYGSISARGGSTAGNGGFVEVSGKRLLQFEGTVDLAAPHGTLGNLLLDPFDITIVTGGGFDLIGTPTDGNATTYAFTEDPATIALIDPGTLAGLNATVTLQALNNLTVSNDVNLTFAGAGFIGQAGNNIALNANITTNGGAITLTANDAGGTQTGSGSITGGGNLTSSSVTAAGGAITLATSGTGSIIVGNINSSGGTTATNGANGGLVSITTVDGLIQTGTITTSGGAAAAPGGATQNGFTGGDAGGVMVEVSNAATALRTISLSGITAIGGTGGDAGTGGGGNNTGGAGGLGGTISVIDNDLGFGASLTAAAITTTGGARGASVGTDDGAVGRNGGGVSVSVKGPVIMAALISTRGGLGGSADVAQPNGNGGVGGTVSVTSTGGMVTLNDVTTTGGDEGLVGTGAGTAGASGTVTASAGTDLTLNGAISAAGVAVNLLFGQANGGGTLTFANTITGNVTATAGNGNDTFNVNTATTADLNGGTGVDVFNINATLTGSVDGQGNGATLAGTQVTNATITTAGGSAGFNGTTDAAALSGTFSNITTINANGGGTLTGGNFPSTWTVNTGTYTDGANTLTYTNFPTLQGGTAIDTFNVGAAASAALKGGLGVDVFNLNATLTGTVDGEGAGATLAGTQVTNATITTAGSSAGFNGTTDAAALVGTFSNITTINANGGGTLTGGNFPSTWTVNTGTYTDGANTLTYTNFPTLQGGTAIDTFNLGANAAANLNGGDGIDVFALATHTLTGTIDGGLAGGSITGIASPTLTALGGTTGFNGTAGAQITGFSNITDLQGTGTLTGLNINSAWNISTGTYTSINPLTFSGFTTLAGGSGVDTVTGSGATYTITGSDTGSGGGFSWTGMENLSDLATGTLKATNATWTLNGSNTGTVNNLSGTFSNMANLTDLGAGTFNMHGTGDGGITGNLVSTSAGSMTYASYTVPVSFGLAGSANTSTGIGGTRSGITSVTGSGFSDTITGSGATYNLTGPDAGNNGTIFWTSFENLTDSGAGVFNMHSSGADGSITGNISAVGGSISYAGYTTGGPLTAGVNFDLGGVSTLQLFGLTNTGIGGTHSGITHVTGSSLSDLIVGTGQTWNLTGLNAGNNGTISWTSFENILDFGNATIVGSAIGTTTGSVSGFIETFGNTTLSGAIKSGGGQFYIGPVTLNGATTLTDTNTGLVYSVYFGSPVTGNSSLAIAAGAYVGLWGGVTLTGDPANNNLTVAGTLPALVPPATQAFVDFTAIPPIGGAVFVFGGVDTGAGTGTVTLSAQQIIGPGPIRTGDLRLTSTAAVVNGLTIDVTNLFAGGAVGDWLLAGNVANLPPQAEPGIHVVLNGVGLTTTALQAQASVAAASAAASASSAVANQAVGTFGTDSVAEQIEFGFAGDVGVLPPMDHRLQGVGISVPKCFNESREGEGC